MGGKLPVDRTGGRLEPMSADDAKLAEIALHITDAVLTDAVQDALREAYALGVEHGKQFNQ